MLMMFDSPILARNALTNSSNLSWPTSMQSVWRIVLIRIFLSVPFAATSSGGNGFAIRLSVGVARTGTLRCVSVFAAAELAMALTTFDPPPVDVVGRLPVVSAPLVRVPLDPTCGMRMVSPHDGQSISLPAPALSTSGSCLHSGLGQLKMISIGQEALHERRQNKDRRGFWPAKFG